MPKSGQGHGRDERDEETELLGVTVVPGKVIRKIEGGKKKKTIVPQRFTGRKSRKDIWSYTSRLDMRADEDDEMATTQLYRCDLNTFSLHQQCCSSREAVQLFGKIYIFHPH